MEGISIQGKTFEKFISAAEIAEQVGWLAQKLNSIYSSTEPPLLLGILNGSFIFMADLVRQLNFDCTIQFIRIESYQGMKSTGIVKMEEDVAKKWENRHVIVIEDIVDTGRTLDQFVPTLKAHHPLSVFVAALLFKEESLEVKVHLDHYCFNIPSYFVLGYGLDFDGLGRNLPEIYKLKE